MTPDEVVETLRAAGCVFAEDEAAILLDAAADPTQLSSMVTLRVEGRPLEHIVGWVAFGGIRVLIDDGVFVPRRRTELLATQASRLAGSGTVVVDMCCGAGAIAAVVSDRAPSAHIVACDLDPAATACARRNVPHDKVFTGDLFDALPDHLRGAIGVIAANAPYVPTDAIAMMPREARDHEPFATLDGGPDGLDVARRIIADAPEWLTPGGHLLIETSQRQAPMLDEAMSHRGFDTSTVSDDDIGGTVVVGTAPHRPTDPVP